MNKNASKDGNEDDTKVTLGADEGYDATEFVNELQRLKVTPHIAQNKSSRRCLTG